MENSKATSAKHTFRLGIFLSKHPFILAAAMFMLGLLAMGLTWYALPKWQQLDTSKYQAVYLINGQMYFGKLHNIDGTYLYMSSPYMPDTSTSSGQQAGDTSTASSALIRVKNQLWGAEDSIAIRADQVAFWQNLRDDSKVSQAIKAKE